MNDKSRRKFIKDTAMGTMAVTVGGLGLSARSYAAIPGANEKIRVAVFGLKRRFSAIRDSLAELPEAEITWLCDIDERQIEKGLASVKEQLGQNPKTHTDLREILQKKDVDAVFIAIPDHWHAHATWMALEAGKHVYVEKPASHNPREGELMVSAWKKYNLACQMGAQQRSSVESQEIIGEIHDGVIGDVYMAQAFYINQRGEVPPARVVPVPDYFDWELFQGPAPRTDFINILEDYMWHWYWEWGTGETGNNATHEVDMGRWALQGKYPEKVSVNGGKFHFRDDPWVMYDTMDASFTFPGNRILKWDGKSRNAYQTYGADRGTIIYGSEGSVFVNRGGYRLYDRTGKMIRERKMQGNESSTGLGGGGSMTTRHIRNFFEAIKGKEKLNMPIDEGAISTMLCHYGNISYRMGNKDLEVNPETGWIKTRGAEQFWSRDYEPGWEPPGDL